MLDLVQGADAGPQGVGGGQHASPPGDLLAALISAVDATQDLFIRGIGPPLAAALVGAGAVTLCLLILAPAGGVLSAEWEAYRREVGRLLAEGHAGRWALFKGAELVGLFDTEAEAHADRSRRFLLQPALVQQVLDRLPVLQITPRYI